MMCCPIPQNLGAAKRALEQGVTQGYKIRLLPQYHLMMARLHILEGDHAQALKFIDQAEVSRRRRSTSSPRRGSGSIASWIITRCEW